MTLLQEVSRLSRTYENTLGIKRTFTDAAIIGNPVLIQAVGVFPIIAMAVSLKSAIALCAITSAVLLVCEVATSLLLRRFPHWLRIGLYMLLGILVVLPASLFFEKFAPNETAKLGIVLPLLAFNSMVALRCEKFARRNAVGTTVLNALSTIFAYSLIVVFVGAVRELLGSGTLYDIPLSPLPKAAGLLMPFGGLLILGLASALLKWFAARNYPSYAEKEDLNISLEEGEK
jgi:electron transport complex protein RnfE